ncbi:hypothetical protein ACLBXM_17810 [Xanthobacteraceae bacterium A53D]
MSGIITVDVDVYIDEVLEKLSDDELLSELRERARRDPKKFEATVRELGLAAIEPAAPVVLVEEALEDLRDGRTADAALVLERICRPKWKAPSEALEALGKLKGMH